MIKYFCDRCKSVIENRKDLRREPCLCPSEGEHEFCPGCYEEWGVLSSHIRKLRHSYSDKFAAMEVKFMDGVPAGDVIMDS